MARDHTRNISLTPELDRYVKAQISSGAYTSASEVVREGLRRLQSERRREDMLLLAALGLDPAVGIEAYDREDIQRRLDAQIQPAIDQSRRGEGIRGDQAFAELRSRINERRHGG